MLSVRAERQVPRAREARAGSGVGEVERSVSYTDPRHARPTLLRPAPGTGAPGQPVRAGQGWDPAASAAPPGGPRTRFPPSLPLVWAPGGMRATPSGSLHPSLRPLLPSWGLCAAPFSLLLLRLVPNQEKPGSLPLKPPVPGAPCTLPGHPTGAPGPAHRMPLEWAESIPTPRGAGKEGESSPSRCSSPHHITARAPLPGLGPPEDVKPFPNWTCRSPPPPARPAPSEDSTSSSFLGPSAWQ